MVRSLAARFAALLFLFSPLAWFHGIVALTYGVEASSLHSLAIYTLLVGVSRQPSLDSGDRLGAGNIRRGEASSLLQPAPLFLLVLYRAAHQVQGERSHCSGARGRSMVCSHCRASARDFYLKWDWILADE
jgi:hypothetical protein